MAPNRLGAGLLLLLGLAACGKDGGSDQQIDLAAMRAKHDSVVAAKAASAARDSAARQRYAACTDSVTAALQQTPQGRAKLAANRPEGMILPELLSACGTPVPAAPIETRVGGTAGSPAADSGSTQSDSLRQAQETAVVREAFAYGGGSRDPFASLLSQEHAGPELADLLLVGVYEDLRYPTNSVAVLKEKESGKRYKLRPGDRIGRMRVARIGSKDVVFTVEDFGYERQATLSLRKQEDVTP